MKKNVKHLHKAKETLSLQNCNVIVEITDIKYGLASKYLFQRMQRHNSCRKALGNNKFLKNNAFQLLCKIKKHSSKQAVPIT